MKSLGFGLGAMLWLIVPGVNLVCVPAAVCGATALLLDLEGGQPERADAQLEIIEPGDPAGEPPHQDPPAC